jgi:hypothetical protein
MARSDGQFAPPISNCDPLSFWERRTAPAAGEGRMNLLFLVSQPKTNPALTAALCACVSPTGRDWPPPARSHPALCARALKAQPRMPCNRHYGPEGERGSSFRSSTWGPVLDMRKPVPPRGALGSSAIVLQPALRPTGESAFSFALTAALRACVSPPTWRESLVFVLIPVSPFWTCGSMSLRGARLTARP